MNYATPPGAPTLHDAEALRLEYVTTCVGFDDLLIVSQNFGSSGKVFTQGNINYSAAGEVDFDDLLILAQNYDHTLSRVGASVQAKAKARVGSASQIFAG